MARQDVAEGFLVRIVALGRCDQSLLVQVAGPAMRAQRQHDLAQFLVISRNQAAFHRRDMVREENTEAVHDTECTGLVSSEGSTHGFEIGRASCRESVCRYVEVSVIAV